MTDNGAMHAHKILKFGALIIFALTLLSQAMAILTLVIANSPDYSESFWGDVVYTLRTLFDSAIFAAGAALIVTFIRLGDRKKRLIAYLTSLVILFLDYGISFSIDYAYGLVDGYETITLLYLLLNFIARATVYALIILFTAPIYNRVGKADSAVPFISLSHPTCRMLNCVFLLRIMPYVLFEIYSNITGIIEYGFDMTGADILSIISAYLEILIDGAIIYCVAYLLVILYSNMIDRAKNA